MTLTELAIKKMSKDDIITSSLDYQNKFNSTQASINKDIGELKYNLNLSRNFRYPQLWS